MRSDENFKTLFIDVFVFDSFLFVIKLVPFATSQKCKYCWVYFYQSQYGIPILILYKEYVIWTVQNRRKYSTQKLFRFILCDVYHTIFPSEKNKHDKKNETKMAILTTHFATHETLFGIVTSKKYIISNEGPLKTPAILCFMCCDDEEQKSGFVK